MTDRPEREEVERLDHEDAAMQIVGECTCHEAYTGRRLIDPQCMYHEFHAEITAALAEAEERGRRKGLEEAAQSLDSHAAYCDEQMKVSGDKHGLWALCRDEALRRARVIRALAAAPRAGGDE